MGLDASKAATRRALRYAAVHEAGHAIVALAVDWTVLGGNVGVSPQRGFTRYVSHADFASDDPEHVTPEKRLCVALAGRAATYALGLFDEDGNDDPSETGDTLAFAASLAYRDGLRDDDEGKAWECAVLAARRGKPTDDATDAVVRAAWRATLAYARRPAVQAAIERYARLLAKRGRLDGSRWSDMAAIVRAAGRVPRFRFPVYATTKGAR